MSFIDYYGLLGVEPSAPEKHIKQAYRQAAQLYHPDVNDAHGAQLVFKRINEAYQTLSDTQKRAVYDRRYRQEDGGSHTLRARVFLSRQHIRKTDAPQLLYALAKIQPLIEQGQESSAPMNLCLVIDRSKSMMGTRMVHVKNAAQRVIDSCGPKDILSVVSFSDNAEVVVAPRSATDKRSMKNKISTLQADGSTAMYDGLRLGVSQLDRYRNPRYVNHLILITDGRTYGDEDKCLELADEARDKGIGISGMGIGEDWHDDFLDDLSSRTGGSSTYISSSRTVKRFLEDRVKRLATAHVERTELVMATASAVNVEELMRISPDPTIMSVASQPISIGSIDANSITAFVLKMHVSTENMSLDTKEVGRIHLSGEVMGTQRTELVSNQLVIEITDEAVDEEPPPEILDALGKLRMYNLQQRAREAMDRGDFDEATRHLEYLSTRLFEEGEDDLAQAARQEAHRVTQTHMLSDEGAKQLKYGTRALVSDNQDFFDTQLLTLEDDTND